MITSFSVKIDADWRITGVKHEGGKFKASGITSIYRDDITEEEDETAWAENYWGDDFTFLFGKPLEIFVAAIDELSAFALAQTWLGEHRQTGG